MKSFGLLIVLLIVPMALASTGVYPKPDAVAQFNENPYMYLMGNVQGGKVVRTNHSTGTAIDFQPTGTMLTETVLFCDNQSETFQQVKMDSEVVVMYTRKGSENGCHELVRLVLVTE